MSNDNKDTTNGFFNKSVEEHRSMVSNKVLEALNITNDELDNILNNTKLESLKERFGILVDVETLGDKYNSVVLSLSGVLFPLDVLDKSLDTLLGKDFPKQFNINLNITEQLDKDRIVTESTIKFWLKDNMEEFKNVINNEGSHLSELSEYIEWIKNIKKLTNARVYHRGVDFDAPIIESLLESAGIVLDWREMGAVRDVRTFIDTCMGTNKGFVIGLENLHSSHNSLNDCLNDIRSMQVAYAYRHNTL